ncbi:radical SAM/SPASM domain-containing protein [Azospirillum sp. A39]|uniref:radical SAM/SPASM domain-containing protein n=1 Tax=Azospirillum sp. A39 TaxID=3462279 RepID=UPI0040462C9F
MSSITQRVDAVTAIPAPYRTAAPPPPRSVKIELTARCDLQCFYCATGYKLRQRADIDWDLLVRLLHEMRDAGVEEIGLFYLGESMLHPRLAEAIHVAKNQCGYPYVFLTTNGRLARPEKVRACMEAGLDSLKFSINAADPAQYKEVTRVDAFDTVIANLKAARAMRDAVLAETGHRCGLYASSILYDGEQRERMQRTVDDLLPYVDEHYFLPLYNQAGFTAGAHGTVPVAGNIGRVGALRDPLPCWAVFTEGHVTYDGKLAACCFDHDGRFDMGDLTTTPFLEAWNGAPFRALRAAHLTGDVRGTVCERCIAYQSGAA